MSFFKNYSCHNVLISKTTAHSMTIKFLTRLKSVSSNLCLKKNYEWKRYDYSVSDSKSDFDSNSVSDSNSDSDSDSNTASINLVIFIFFGLYLHSSK